MTKHPPFRYFKTSPEIIRLRSAVRAKGGFAETAINALTRQAEVTVEAYYKV